MRSKFFLLLSFIILSKFGFSQAKKKSLAWEDIPAWSYTRLNTATFSNDGKWFAVVSGPTEGDLTLTLRRVADTTKYEYAIGGQSTPVQINENSSFLAFYESPKHQQIEALKKQRKPIEKTLKIVNLQDTSTVSFEKIASFSFANDAHQWIAMRFAGAPTPPNSPNKGSDLLLYNLDNKQNFNIGNVNEFSFNKSGRYLAYTVDAAGMNGNGIFLKDLSTGMTYALHNDKANFSKIRWNKEGTAFALLKSKKEKGYKDPVFTLIGVKDINGQDSKVITYTGLDENQITSGYGLTQNSQAYWSKDLNHIFFGIAKIEKEEDKNDKIKTDTDSLSSDSTAIDSAAIDSTALAADDLKDKKPKTAPKNKKDLEKPNMIIWNWQDKRLQSAQQLQLQGDKNFTMMSVLNVQTNEFSSLADNAIKNINLAPNNLYGVGYDFTPYELEANLDGQQYADIYTVDIKTGERKLILEKQYLNANRGIRFSPDSEFLVYYQKGNYFAYNLKTDETKNLTETIPADFVRKDNDHNVQLPSTPLFGFSRDSKYVFIRDNFDLWKIELKGKSFSSLTDNWASQNIAAGSFQNIYPDVDYEGIDLSVDQYITVFDEKTKQMGFAILPAKKNKFEILTLTDDMYRGISKVKNAQAFYYMKENSSKSPEIFLTKDQRLTNDTYQLTSNTPDEETFGISAGSRLIEYVSDHGDTLQAVLYLPADYVEGNSYPTITYIYERLTQNKNTYSNPAFPGGGFNRAMYTSNGYAVLMPDIKYKLNQPGMSAVACVVPAVKAAIATGIVDEDKVGIQGHSWGGYQTSFLITQTDIFKAAVAGAPLTNMISMYSLIYWNSGSSNQSIFESSQGRLTTGYWDNWESYAQNSPIYHIKKVNTPLVIMHNDKDGAVDYTQGVEYYNGLRRLNKPVVMLTYKGENHGLMKEVNKKDYAVRMMEFYDHYLKGTPAPDWWSKGIDLIDLEKHLEERAF